MDNLPEFPKIDLAGPINWMVNGFTSLVTSNAPLVIGAGLIMFLVPFAIVKVKNFGKKAVK